MTVLGWHPQDIIAAIKKQGWTHQQIADHLEISRATVSLGVRTGCSPVVRKFVANLIGVSEQELWTHRFPSTEMPNDK